MNLNARLRKLERTVKNAPPAPCPVCGAPVGWVPSLRLVNEDGADLGPTCPRCNFPLMNSGRAVWAMRPGSPQHRVVLDRPLPE